MRETFSSYYRPTDQELQDLWRDCRIVLDGTVLVNLHRYPDAAREGMLKLLGELARRLWVPHQAALEYHQARRDLILQRAQSFRRVRDEVDEVYEGFRTALESLAIERGRSVQGLERRFKNLMKTLEEFEQEALETLPGEALQQELEALLTARIGAPPRSRRALERLCEECQERYAQRRPPGYLEGREGAYLCRGLSIERRYAPMVLWKQILDQVQNDEAFKSLILVTDRQGADWWVCDAGGRPTATPRPELIEEVMSTDGARCFYMYDSGGFMAAAGKYLQLQIKPQVLAELQAF
ncbi:MAG: PIN-like domain-containing protein [Anaerolineales bacterium]